MMLRSVARAAAAHVDDILRKLPVTSHTRAPVMRVRERTTYMSGSRTERGTATSLLASLGEIAAASRQEK
jgi:hypothetical protein